MQPATCICESAKTDIDALVRIADLFRFRWDPPILAVLAERPSRFRALHKRLETHVSEHVDDNALTRSLHRLTRSGLVQADSRRLGSRAIKTYSLSDRGREHLKTYEAILAAYANLHIPRYEYASECPVHDRRETDRAA